MIDEVLRRHAEILKDSPLLDIVFDEIEGRFIDRWRSGANTTAREQAFAGITTCTELREIVDDRLRELSREGDPGDGAAGTADTG